MVNQTEQHELINPDSTPCPVFVLSDEHEAGSGPWHAHRRIQLVHVSKGVLSVLTRKARFVVPPQRAVWIGSGIEHRIVGRAPFWLTTCYVEPDVAAATIAGNAAAVAVDRLTDELLIAAATFGGSYANEGPEARLIAVLMDRLAALNQIDIILPEPADRRLRRITNRLLEDPSCQDTLVKLSAAAGLTERTAARLFLNDTGLTFGRWRQQMRLQASLEQLGGGASVTQAAFAVGYADVSSFIAAFRLLFGKTPSRILAR
jgi:AraC-like DNA-binding protein